MEKKEITEEKVKSRMGEILEENEKNKKIRIKNILKNRKTSRKEQKKMKKDERK